MSDAGLLELDDGLSGRWGPKRSGFAHKINDRIDVFPLPEAPISKTYDVCGVIDRVLRA